MGPVSEEEGRVSGIGLREAEICFRPVGTTNPGRVTRRNLGIRRDSQGDVLCTRLVTHSATDVSLGEQGDDALGAVLQHQLQVDEVVVLHGKPWCVGQRLRPQLAIVWLLMQMHDDPWEWHTHYVYGGVPFHGWRRQRRKLP